MTFSSPASAAIVSRKKTQTMSTPAHQASAQPQTHRRGHDSVTFAFSETCIHMLSYGARQLTGKGVRGPPPDRQNALGASRRAFERGVNYVQLSNAQFERLRARTR